MIVAPRSETEHAVAAFWKECGLRPASIDDRFQEIGGSPERAFHLLSLIRERWGVQVSLDDLLSASTIARQSYAIERKRAEARTRENGMLADALTQLEALESVPEFD